MNEPSVNRLKMNRPQRYVPEQVFTVDADRPLLPTLLVNAPEIHFFRFCELLELAAPEHPLLGGADTPATDPVRFRSRARLAFPNREIDAVEFDRDHPGAPPTVRTTFLGLYGTDARMPSYFVDEVALNRDGAEHLAGFLDLFHHRVVTQDYRIWRKYRYPAGFKSITGNDISHELLSLVGLGMDYSDIAQAVGTRQLLAMLGLACQKTRTAEGLAGVLQHAVPDARISVEECFPVWVNTEGYQQTPLGENCLLGRGFYDRANTVRIAITPQLRESVLDLMPGQLKHRAVIALLRFYLAHEAQAHLELQVRPELMPAPVLNSNQVCLGYTTQLPRLRASGSVDRAGALTRVQLGVWAASHDGNAPAHTTHEPTTSL